MTSLDNSSSISRRSALAGLGAGGLGLTLAGTAHHAGAQDSTPGTEASHPIVGTWMVDRNPDDPSEPPTIAVFTADGAILDPIVGTAGAWHATGPRTAAWTLVGLSAGGADGYFVVRVTGEVDEDGLSYAASNTITIVAPDGTVMASFPSAPRGIRLPIEPEDAGGAALAGFPTWAPAPPADATPTA